MDNPLKNASTLELIWTPVVFLGLCITSIVVWKLWGDRRAYELSEEYHAGDPLDVFSKGRIRTELTRLWMFFCFTFIGIIALQAPPSTDNARATPLAITSAIAFVSIAVIKTLDSLVYLHERRQRLEYWKRQGGL